MTIHYVSRGVVAWHVSRETSHVSRETFYPPSHVSRETLGIGGGRVVRPCSL